jgi:protein arginine N-methyltransferase 1
MHTLDGYTIKDYGRMILDERRTEPFVQALLRAVTPGCTVLDIGTSTGYFAFLALQAGAARVYAVEPDEAIEVARRCASTLPGAERIHWIQGMTTELDLPEQVDVVIGDLHGVLPFYNANIASMIDARKRHLKPGGQIIPAQDRMFLVPANAPEEYQNLEEPWVRNSHGLDLSAARQYVANSWWRVNGKPVADERLLAPAASWGSIDYRTVEHVDLEDTLAFTIERADTLHGYYVWFDGEMAEGLGYSNAPNLPELVYGRGFMPLEQAVDVVPGDKVEVRIGARVVGGDYVFRWDTRVIGAGGAVKGEFRQSTFRSRVIIPGQLRKAAVDYVPTLNAEGEVMRFLLANLGQGKSVNDIAAALAGAFPGKFATAESALRETVRVTQKYG